MNKLKKLVFASIISFQKINILPVGLRRLLLISTGMEIGKGTIICAGVDFKSKNIQIGSNSLINRNCHLYVGKDSYIRIGSNVQLAYDVLVCTQTHKIGDKNKRAGTNYEMDVAINDGVWIGMGTKILPGTEVSKGVVIGAGAVCLGKLDADALYIGVPARKVKELN